MWNWSVLDVWFFGTSSENSESPTEVILPEADFVSAAADRRDAG